MSDDEIELLDQYILASDKEKFFSSLVRESKVSSHLRLLDHVNRYGIDLPADSRIALERVSNSPSEANTYAFLVYQILCLENETDESKRASLIAEFNKKCLKKNFYNRRPSVLDQSTMHTSKELSCPSELVCDQYGFVECEKRFFSHRDLSIKDIKQAFYYRFDLQRLLTTAQKDLADFQWVMANLPSFTHVPSISKVFLEYESKAKKLHKSKAFSLVIEASSYEKMTLTQLEELQQALPLVLHDKYFVASKFRKVFERELFDLDQNCDIRASEDLPRCCQILGDMYKWVRSLPQMKSYLTFAAHILRTLLELDLRRNVLDEENFKEYLSNPLRFDRVVYGVRQSVEDLSAVGNGGGQDAGEDDFWCTVHNLNSNHWTKEKDFVTKALRLIFMKGAEYSSYTVYLDRAFLQKQYYISQMLMGNRVESVTELLGESVFTTLREEKHLRFVPWNKTRFQPGESITLDLEVKNISNVLVNIYEIDTENYYRKHMSKINDYIDLTGLMPNKSFERALLADPMVLQTVVFENLFSAKRGVYVIDFVGDGLSSRALIRVGALSTVTQSLSKGVLIHIIDEQKRVCRGKDTALVIGNRVMKPIEMLHNGILVPFAEKPSTETIILLHDDFAELDSVYLPSDEVSLSCALLLNEEALQLVGSVELVLLPKLTVNDQNISLVSLKGVKVTVTATSTKGVNSITTYEDVTIDQRGKAIVLSYDMKSKTERLIVEMAGRFFSSAKGKYMDLSCQESVRVNRFIDQNVFYDLYLSPSGERNMKLHFLGKNGEPYARQRVQVSLQSIYLFANEKRWEELQTNEKGEILLVNAIPQICDLHAQMLDPPSSIKREIKCDMTNTDRITSLRQTYSVMENEEVSLPMASPQFLPSEYELVRVSRTNVACIVSDCHSQIICKDGMVHLTELTEGVYRFTYRDYNVSLFITVHVGKQWASLSQQYVEKKDTIVELSDRGPCLSYKHFKMHDGCVEFSVASSDMNSVQVHALAFNYFPRTLPVIRESLQKLQVDQGSETYRLRDNRCTYLSEKKLSDEFKYVLDRKRRRKIVGSTLEKPSALLKRHLIRETHEDEEILEEQDGYEAPLAAQKAVPYSAYSNAMPRRGMRSACGTVFCPYAAQPFETEDNFLSCTYTVENLSSFLPTCGWSRFRILPDNTGHVSIQVPEDQGYTTLVFILRDHKSSLVEWVPLPERSTPTFRDLRLNKSKENGVVYVQERQAHCLEKGGIVQISDPDTADLNVVDSIGTLFNLLFLINPHPSMVEWKFLTNWHAMSPREKLEKYDQYACHELNLFVYFKDQEFFTAVVKPYLQCKSRKQFIDYFLLGDVTHLVKYFSPARLEMLNVLERALLVLFFVKERGPECQAIALDIAHRVESQGLENELSDSLFDTIVLGGVTNEEEKTRQSLLSDQTGAKNNDEEAENRSSNVTQGNSLFQKSNVVANSVGAVPESSPASTQSTHILNSEGYESAIDGIKELGARIIKYRGVDTTNEYVEKHYFNENTFDVVPNKFWADVIDHFAAPVRNSLLTENFMHATRNLTEMLVVLALLDVPPRKGSHDLEKDGYQQKLVLQSNAIVFTKVIREKKSRKIDSELLMTQKFYDPTDMYLFSSDGTKTLKSVEEFVSGKLYVSKVVLTNASELDLPLCVVHEVPQGAIPVGSLQYSQYIDFHLEPLSTHMLKFFFYFPRTGEFTCYPATASKDGCLLHKASIQDTFKVFRCPTVVTKDTISNVINNGSKADILAFMERSNLYQTDRFQFQAIYWLLNDKQFYMDVMALLRRKHIFEEKVWSFSIKHGDYATFTEYLELYLTRHPLVLTGTGATEEPLLYLSTKTMHVDMYEYTDYYPLVLSRAHEVGKSRCNIRNREFKEAYKHFLRYLAQKSPHLTTKDYIYLCIYLLLQERLDDCLAVYQLIKHTPTADHCFEKDKELQIQFDYLTAYLDQYLDYPAFRRARDISVKYLTYPVFTWRNRFIKLLNQIAEVDGEGQHLLTQGDTSTNRELTQMQAEVEPYLAAVLHLADNSIKLTLRNIKQLTVLFYKIDIEVLFSKDPFRSLESVDYSYVCANMTQTQLIPEPLQIVTTESVPIPQNLQASNLSIQVKADSQIVNLTYFPKTMTMIFSPNNGVVRVLAERSKKPLTGVYIKTFARTKHDKVIFFKDGYTDLRGSFEYASLHSNKLEDIKEFSLLILSAEFGGRIERVGPPSTIATVELGSTQIVSGAVQALYAKKVQDSQSKYCL